MRYQDRQIRNSLQYKIKMWFYHLTFRDVGRAAKISFITANEILIFIFGFIIIFVLPHLFH